MTDTQTKIDVMASVPRDENGRCYTKCLDKGFVGLVDVMPRLVKDGQTADSAIVEAARVSFGDGTKTVGEDRGLIRFLFRHRHSTPVEMVEFKFHCKMPIFVARQWIRHRTANVNEVSGRYSVLKDDFYLPGVDEVRKQSTTNKQASEGSVDDITDARNFLTDLEQTCEASYRDYERALKAGIGRELARMLLPVNLYTAWYWKIDLHNLLHFLSLRADSHAQMEIRVFAEAMINLITPIVPWAVEAWEDYHPLRGAVTLSRLEVVKLHDILSIQHGAHGPVYAGPLESGNKREDQEWQDKAVKIGLRQPPLMCQVKTPPPAANA